MSEWRPIETCPAGEFALFYEDGAVRLLFYEGGEFQSPDWAVNEWGDIAGDKIKVRTLISEPTHWMPLPELPKR